MIPAVLLSVLLAAAPAADKAPVHTVDLLPAADELAGWEAGKRRTVSSSRGLYDYMNGGAEIYIDYGFHDLAVGEWTFPGGDPLKVEVYRMGRPKSAFGMFTQDTWGKPVEIGQGGQIQGGTLRFWKGSYFVRVFMWRGYQDHLTEIMDMGRAVADGIPNIGAVPVLVSFPPAEGLAEGGLHFFHTALTLGTFYYLSEGNPLALSEDTDGVIGEYLLDDQPVFLTLLSYPDAEGAEHGFEGFVRASGSDPVSIEEDKNNRRTFTVEEDKLWRKIVKAHSYVVLVLDCPSEDSCDALLDDALADLEGFVRMETRLKNKMKTENAD